FDVTTQRYARSVTFLYRHKWITPVILLASAAGIYWAATTTPTGFVPTEDRGMIFANIELPPGATLDRTVEVTKGLNRKLEQVDGVRGASLINGFSLISGAGSNFSLGFIRLDPWDERKADSLSVSAITAKLFQIAAGIPGANMVFFAPPSVPGFGVSSGFEMNVLDRFGGDFNELDRVTREFLGQLMQRPEILYAQSAFNTNYPQFEMDINVSKAKEAGVSISDIFGTLQGYIGSVYAADFARFGKQYRVYVQALPEDRASVNDLNALFVRNANREMAPITEFVTLKRVYGPQSVTRYNLFNSADVNGAPAPGYSTGDAIAAVQEVSATALPNNYMVDFTGLTREEISAGNQTTFIIILCIVFIYFILAAQYESYMIPFAVLFSLPVGVMGAYVSTKLAGLEVNIYFQIALIMLLGLLAKNAILIVEFALQRRRAGYTILDAAVEGAKVRLRPILMTSFAFIIGLLPLVFAAGVGAAGNNSIGTGAVGGLLIGTVLGVFVIPILYILFQWLHEKFSRNTIKETPAQL
ncbi:MAG TPA: efflux RND transporter permease subunit, partial [Cyclobacteriaceae bacterium]|nr:efflux RND transporter permease subunit [Cyclobacteriaceae bacterium]